MDSKPGSQLAAINADAAVELGQKSIEAITQLTQQNLDLMLTVTNLTAKRIQAAVGDAAKFTRQNLERSSEFVRAIGQVTSPSELLQVQADFAHVQFGALRAELTKVAETLGQTAAQKRSEQSLASFRSGEAPIRTSTRRTADG